MLAINISACAIDVNKALSYSLLLFFGSLYSLNFPERDIVMNGFRKKEKKIDPVSVKGKDKLNKGRQRRSRGYCCAEKTFKWR